MRAARMATKKLDTTASRTEGAGLDDLSLPLSFSENVDEEHKATGISPRSLQDGNSQDGRGDAICEDGLEDGFEDGISVELLKGAS